jgi:acyl-CoA reductase-like NAD-dependent aldehyde dehydrogenase
VEELLGDAKEKGARVIEGGERHELGGFFYQPTVVSGVTADMAFATEEIFGPVAPVFKFSSEEEVIELANATEFGLASYFYARDLGRVFRVAEALEYGMVCVNDGILSTEVAPFGGVKESGETMTDLDLDFVRSNFPAFSEPSLQGWGFFENAGGSYACGQTIDWLNRYYRQTKVQPYYDFPGPG